MKKKKRTKAIPYLYQKLGELIGADNNGYMKLPELQNKLINFRIEKREALKIAKELEKQGLVVLDIQRGANQHLKIRVVKKSTAVAITVAFMLILYMIVWMLSTAAAVYV